MKFQIYKRIDGDFGWRLRSSNGRPIAVSGEGYRNKSDCNSAILLVKGSALASVEDTTVPILGDPNVAAIRRLLQKRR